MRPDHAHQVAEVDSVGHRRGHRRPHDSHMYGNRIVTDMPASYVRMWRQIERSIEAQHVAEWPMRPRRIPRQPFEAPPEPVRRPQSDLWALFVVVGILLGIAVVAWLYGPPA